MIFRGKLIKVKADSTNKQFFVLIFLACFLLLITLNYISNYVVPQTFLDLNGLENCPEDYETFRGFCHHLNLNQGNKWQAYIGGLSKENQVLWISGEATKEINQETSESYLELEYTVKVFYLDFLKNENIESLTKDYTHQNNIIVKCSPNDMICDGNNFLTINPKESNQVIKIEIEIYRSKQSDIKINGINFYAKTIDKTFIQFLLVLRLFCLILSVSFGIAYLIFLKNIPCNLRTFEHKYLGLISVFLILFNNPFYGFSVIQQNLFFIVIGNLLIVSYLSILFTFWFIMMIRIHKENVMITTNLQNTKTKIISILIFLLMFFYSLLVNYFNKVNPGFHIDAEYPKFFKFYILLCTIICFGTLGLIIYSLWKVYKNWNKIIPRHKFFFIFSLYFMIIFFMLGLSFFNDFNNHNGIEILLFFILNNFYVIMMQLLWRFSHKGLIELEDYQNEVDKLNKSQTEKSILGKSYLDDEFNIKINRRSKKNSLKKKQDSISKDVFEIKKNTVLSVSSFNISDNSSGFKNEHSDFNLRRN